MPLLKDSIVTRILRIFLWLAVLAVIGIGILLLVGHLVEENRIANLKKEAQELHTKVTRAQNNATPREWNGLFVESKILQAIKKSQGVPQYNLIVDFAF